jgi:hypothetical protein
LIAAVTPPETAYILPSNPQRVGVSIAVTPLAGNALIQVRSSDAIVTINETFPPFNFLHYTVKTHGELPTYRWNVAGDGVTTNIVIIEYYLPNEVLDFDFKQLVAK